jgi:hypothetical protein
MFGYYLWMQTMWYSMIIESNTWMDKLNNALVITSILYPGWILLRLIANK